jgi:hypothetical protein
MSVADASSSRSTSQAEAAVLERQRVVERLRRTDLGRGQPGLEELATDPRWRSPALASPPVAAVLVEVGPASHRRGAAEVMRSWGDVSVYSQGEEEALLLGGVVQRARMQIGLFTVILTLTAAVIVMMVMYNLTLEKTHDLAVLKLMGAPRHAPAWAWCCSKRGCWVRSATRWPSPWASWPIRCSRAGCSSRRPSRWWRPSRPWPSSRSPASSVSPTSCASTRRVALEG